MSGGILSHMRFETGYGKLAFVKEGYDTGRPDYSSYIGRLRFDFSSDDGVSFFVAAGAMASHGDAPVLGSSRYILGGELGIRYRKTLLWNIAVVGEVGAMAGVAKEKLNFGAGIPPEYSEGNDPTFSFHPHLTARAGLGYKNFNLLFGALSGMSLGGFSYTDYGTYLLLSASFGLPAQIQQVDCASEIEELQQEVDESLASFTRASSLQREVMLKYEGQKSRLEALLKNVKLCKAPEFYKPADVEITAPQSRPSIGSCASSEINRLEKFAKELKRLKSFWDDAIASLQKSLRRLALNEDVISQTQDWLIQKEKLQHELFDVVTDARIKYEGMRAIQERVNAKQAQLASHIAEFEQTKIEYEREGAICEPVFQPDKPKPIELGPQPKKPVPESCVDLEDTKHSGIKDVLAGMRTMLGKYAAAIDQLRKDETLLDGQLGDLKWSCAKFPKKEFPRNYVFFANDNPKVAKSMQWRLGRPTEDVIADLDQWMVFLAQHPGYHILVDSYANDGYSELSEEQARRVAKRLAKERGKFIKNYMTRPRRIIPEYSVRGLRIDQSRIHLRWHGLDEIRQEALAMGLNPKASQFRSTRITVLQPGRTMTGGSTGFVEVPSVPAVFVALRDRERLFRIIPGAGKKEEVVEEIKVK